ncbi:MAG: PKD domain-containing protein [Candidatus Gracilibacteria bacterium]|nr:PKD domain-containing protein [Candidatus Gracilibacteria bacterium]
MILNRIFQSFWILFGLFFIGISNTIASTDKVEDVFLDIDSNYQYINELQGLYDNGIIQPDIHGKFQPNKLLSREEFVGILSETNCTKCVKPNTSYLLVDVYSQENSYFDVHKKSKYYYCIADSKTKGHIQGYPTGAACQNGDQQENSIAFCPYNTIVLEEALAIIMRRGNILSHDEATYFLSQMDPESPYPDLSSDVKLKDNSGNIYEFYPYFYTAKDYLLSEYNIDGEKQTYQLVEKQNNLYNPQKAITREDFLKMAVFAMKNSNCIDFKNDNISGDIRIVGNKCSKNDTNCIEKADYVPGARMDIYANIGTQCALGIDEDTGYNWIVYNLRESKEETQTGYYLDDFSFQQAGDYKINLSTIDNCGDVGEITKYITIQDEYANAFSATILHSQSADEDGVVDFNVVSEGGEGPFSYKWDFGDGNIGTGEKTSHKYTNPGIYNVSVVIIDANGVEVILITEVKVSKPFTYYGITHEELMIGDDSFSHFIPTDGNDSDNEGMISDDGLIDGTQEDGELTYEWNFGDGTLSTLKDPVHVFENPGVYTVTLTITDPTGGIEVLTYVVTIDPDSFIVYLDTNAIKTDEGLDIDFTSNVIGGKNPLTYKWNFGDGTSSTEEDPNHIYTNPGIYDVTLEVIDGSGITQIIETTIVYEHTGLDSEIIALPDDIIGGKFSFENITHNGTPPFTYEWDFGDKNKSEGKTPGHIYKVDGRYLVTGEVTDAGGNTSTDTIYLIVKGQETAGFNIDISANKTRGTEPLIVDFGVEVTGGRKPFTYTWNFDDGTIGIGTVVKHTYTDPGTYDVGVIVTDDNGMKKTGTIVITVSDDGNGGDDNNDEKTDGDGDGLKGVDDKCPTVFGSIKNKGCPIFITECSEDNDCPENARCGINDKGTSVCMPVILEENCNYSGNSTVFGNVVCDTCPCKIVLDFNATLRPCDIVFPAITSPDQTQFYSRGKYFQLQK